METRCFSGVSSSRLRMMTVPQPNSRWKNVCSIRLSTMRYSSISSSFMERKPTLMVCQIISGERKRQPQKGSLFICPKNRSPIVVSCHMVFLLFLILQILICVFWGKIHRYMYCYFTTLPVRLSIPFAKKPANGTSCTNFLAVSCRKSEQLLRFQPLFSGKTGCRFQRCRSAQ